MTITVTATTAGPFAGNGSTTAFPFTFKAMAGGEVQVVQTVGGAESVVSPVAYTVKLNSGEGGTVTFLTAPAVGTSILIVSNPSFAQQTSFKNAGSFLPTVVDQAFDRAAIRDLFLKDSIETEVTDRIAGDDYLYGVISAETNSATAARQGAEAAQAAIVAALAAGGSDVALRADLATNSGFTLVKYKSALIGTFARSGAALKAMGGDDSDGLNLIQFIDPSYDDELIANAGVPALDSYFAAAHSALATIQASTGRKQRLLIPPFVYPLAAAWNISTPDVTLSGKGAKLTTSMTTSAGLLGLMANNITVEGLHVYLDGTSSIPWCVEVQAANCKLLDGCKLEKLEGTGGTVMYLRSGASGFQMLRSETAGSNGINCYDASDLLFAFNRFRGKVGGADDAIAIKALLGLVERIGVFYNYFENLVAFLSLGSEIGTAAANDSTYSRAVHGARAMGNWGLNCQCMFYLKPGGNDAVDYRDGRIRGTDLSHNTLHDPLGTRLLTGIWYSPGRGSQIIDTTGKENKIIGRYKTGGSNLYGKFYDLRNDGVGTADVLMDGEDVAISVHDPYNGVAAGGSAPGAPCSRAVHAEQRTAGHGTLSNIVLDVAANGTLNDGIQIGSGLDDSVFIRRAKLTNINAGGSSVFGGISALSRIMVGTDISISLLAGRPYVFPTAGLGDVICPELIETSYLGSYAASATTPVLAPWAAKRRCELISVDMLTSNALAQDATNKTTLSLANMDLAGTTFATWSNDTAGADGSNKRSAITANTLTPVYHRHDVTVAADQAQGLFARNGRLKLTKSVAGTGGGLTDARVVIRAAPY